MVVLDFEPLRSCSRGLVSDRDRNFGNAQEIAVH